MRTCDTPIATAAPGNAEAGSMAERDGWIWYDGAMMPWRSASTHVLTHTLHYGLGVFEGVRAYRTSSGTAIFRLAEHTRRLLQSARILAMELPHTAEALMAAQREVVRANRLPSAYIRPLAFLGAERMGVNPDGARVHVAIAAWPWGSYLGEGAAANGIRVRISSYARHHVNVQMCRSKSVSTYANSILANREARAEGYDEALLLDTEGFVAEGAGENLFLVRDGRLLEPAPTSALEGITRDTILQLAREEGIAVESRRVTRDETYIADEAFFTGTAAEVTPIVEIDRRRIGDGRPGPLTRRLMARFRACVEGRDERHANWLTAVG